MYYTKLGFLMFWILLCLTSEPSLMTCSVVFGAILICLLVDFMGGAV